jgi:demethylspheroidene O-methyltransferase
MIGALLERLLRWRDRLLADPNVQNLSVAIPGIRTIANKRARDLFALCTGFVHTQIVTACVELGVLDILAEGPQSAGDVARRAGLEASAAERLLDGAVALRLIRRLRSGAYRLDELGAALRGAPGVSEMIRHNQTFYRDAQDPVAILKRARPTTELAGYWPYAEGDDQVRNLQKIDIEQYSQLMAATQPQISSDVIATYPFGQHETLLDVGGGTGAFVGAVANEVEDLKVAVFDLPPVAEQATRYFAEAGLAERAAAYGGDFHRDPIPQVADVISLVRILLDHDDATIKTLLASVFAALSSGGRVLVAEPMSRAPGAELLSDAYFGLYLMAMGRGRTRTIKHIQDLLAGAGFVRARLVRTRRPLMTQLIVADKS